MSGQATLRDSLSPPPFMAGHSQRRGSQWVRPAQIIDWVAQEYEISAVAMLGQSREAYLVEARALAVWAMRGLCGTPSYPLIVRALGGRDHSTAISLHEKAICLRLRSPDFASSCIRITRDFQSRRKLHVRKTR